MFFFPKLRGFVLSIVHSAEIAEEIASDTLLQVWLLRAKLTTIDHLSSWLHVSARNRALNHLDKSAKTSLFSLDILDVQGRFRIAGPDQLLISRESMEQLSRAVNELPPKCRLVFRMIREEGLSYKEVAQVLNISVNTIDAQMAIAVKRILKKTGHASWQRNPPTPARNSPRKNKFF